MREKRVFFGVLTPRPLCSPLQRSWMRFVQCASWWATFILSGTRQHEIMAEARFCFELAVPARFLLSVKNTHRQGPGAWNTGVAEPDWGPGLPLLTTPTRSIVSGPEFFCISQKCPTCFFLFNSIFRILQFIR